ncbi:MAG: hypothetical protein EXR50_07895 [Dehalococcoidia bacterium]|nr:hypothetical protein [Dehalococcoidia bacterium]
MLARLGLVLLAAEALLMSVLSEGQIWRHQNNLETLTPFMRTSVAAFAILLSGIGLILVLLCCLPKIGKGSERFALAAALFMLSLAFLSAISFQKSYGLDSGAAPNYAAELLLARENPYTTFSLSDAIDRYGMPSKLITRFTDGTLKEDYMYPAGSFVSLVPAVLFGIPDVRPIYAAAVLVLALLLHYVSPSHLKILALALFVAIQLADISLVGSGVTEPWWVLPVVLAWMFRSRWRLSAGLLGYAMSLKQLTWLFAPFLIIAVYHQHGKRRAAATAGIAAAVFAILNAPFVILSPGPWLASVLSPMLDPESALGVGPAILGAHLLPQIPRAFYTIASLGVLSASLLWFFLKGYNSPLYALALPWIPFWFSWRSLSTYFLYLPTILLLGLMFEARRKGQEGGSVDDLEITRDNAGETARSLGQRE